MNSQYICLFFLSLFFFLNLRKSHQYTFGGHYIYDLETADLSSEVTSWTLSNAVSSAKTYTTLVWTTMPSRVILGGPNILGPSGGSTSGQYFERVYTNIPAHTFVSFTLIVWYFDDWGSRDGSPGLKFYFDGQTVDGPDMDWGDDFWSYEGGKNLASGSRTEDLGFDHIKGGVSHSGSTLTFRVISLADYDSIDQPFGFREVSLFFSNYAGATPSLCHISEEIDVSLNACPCQLNEAQNSGGTCQSCSTGCSVCFGVAANQCLLCNTGLIWDGSTCAPCHIYCQTCTGATQNDCSICNDGYYNYQNGTCSDSCPAPFKTTPGTKPLCNKPCSTGSFYFSYNQSCVATCNSPLVQSTDVNGILYCSNPCLTVSDYLYNNGSCYTACVSPLVSRTEPGVIFCFNPCPDPTNNYLYANGTCSSSCMSPLVSRTEPGTKYCWNPCADPVNDYLYINGTCFSDCISPLVSRSEPGVAYCFNPCPDPVNQYLYTNGSCFGTCVSPLISRTEPGTMYCWNPCPNPGTDYLYINGTCSGQCVSPLVSRSEPGVVYCFNPCPDPVNQYLYTNGSCFGTCVSPLVSRTEPGTMYCWNPCPDPINDSLYFNGTCSSECVTPLVSRNEPGTNYCWNPCPNPLADYLYTNRSCFTTCPSPLVSRSEPGTTYCFNPCPNPNVNFLYKNESCFSTCPAPLANRIEPDVQYCFNPCPSISDFLYTNRSCFNTCPLPLYNRSEPDVKYCFNPCEATSTFLYPNQSCIANCPAPLANRSEPGVKYCFNPCPITTDYLYANETCYPVCNSPLMKSQKYTVNLCSAPCSNPNDYYYMLYKKCMSICSYPFYPSVMNTVVVCLLSVDVTEDEFNEVTKDSNLASDVGGYASTAIKVMSVLNSQSPSFISIGGLAAMLQYIRYLRINYPPKLRLLFLLLNSNPITLGLNIEMPYNIDDRLPNEPLPDIFELYQLDSNFLLNYWDSLSSIVAILFGSSCLLVFKYFTKKYKRINIIIRKLLEVVQWNLPLIYLCGNFGSMEFFAVLELRSNTHQLDISLLSFVICIVMVSISIGVLLKTVYIAIDIRKILSQDQSTSKHEAKWTRYNILWRNCKEDTLVRLAHMATFLTRSAICNIIVAGPDGYPLAQAVVLALSSFFMCVYLIGIRPLKEKLDLIQLLVNEILLFVVNICVLILAIMDKMDLDRQGFRVFLGDVIIKISSIFSTCALFFMIIQLVLMAIEAYKMIKVLRKRGLTSISQLIKYAFVNMVEGEGDRAHTKPEGGLKLRDQRQMDLNSSSVENSIQILSHLNNISFNESQNSPDDSRLKKVKFQHPHRSIRRIKKPEGPIKLQIDQGRVTIPHLSQTNPSASTSNYLSSENIFVEGEDSIINLENDSQKNCDRVQPIKIGSSLKDAKRIGPKRRKKTLYDS